MRNFRPWHKREQSQRPGAEEKPSRGALAGRKRAFLPFRAGARPGSAESSLMICRRDRPGLDACLRSPPTSSLGGLQLRGACGSRVASRGAATRPRPRLASVTLSPFFQMKISSSKPKASPEPPCAQRSQSPSLHHRPRRILFRMWLSKASRPPPWRLLDVRPRTWPKPPRAK